MRFRTFLKESTDIVSVIKGGFKQNFIDMQDGRVTTLYRGLSHVTGTTTDGGIKFVVVPESTTPRRSTTNSNLLLNFVVTSPKWKNVPNRQFAVMAGTKSEVAAEFGDPWLIIPADNVTKFAMSERDFNETRIPGLEANFLDIAQSFNDLYDNFLSVQDDLSGKSDDLDQAEERLLGVINKCDFSGDNLDKLSDSIRLMLSFDDRLTASERQVIGKVYGYSKLTEIARELTQGGTLLLSQMFDKYVTPETMGVSVGKLPVAGHHRYDEVWFEGAYLAIRPAASTDYGSFTIDDKLLKDIYDEVIK
jgi:hypothetical protein